MPDFAIVGFRRRRRPAKVTRDSRKTARDWVASTSEPTNRRPTMHRWLFEVEGGHGLTQWTRRRVEGTRPSRIDPVVAPNTARGSEKVTQKKSSSSPKPSVRSTTGSRAGTSAVTSGFFLVTCHFCRPPTSPETEYREIGHKCPLEKEIV